MITRESGSEVDLPVALIHVGARSYTNDPDILRDRQQTVQRVLHTAWPKISAGMSALEGVASLLEMLELEPSCNAGFGAVVQSDGMARLSASIMNGRTRKFSGVMLVTHVIHPSRLALVLQDRAESVLGPYGAQLLAREIGLPPESPVTPRVARSWAEYVERSHGDLDRSGTVGAVVLDRKGDLCAGTSTGGTYMNHPERVSDSATVAGNYASPVAAISCTGIGEQIVDDGVAVRLETRVQDGMLLRDASDRMFEEATARSRSYGWIALDRKGSWAAMSPNSIMPFGVMSGSRDEPFCR